MRMIYAGGFKYHTLILLIASIVQRLSFAVFVVASPQLIAREDSLWDPLWGPIIDGSSEILDDLGTKTQDFFLPQSPDKPVVQPDTPTDAAPSGTADIEIKVTGTPLPSTNQECDPDDVSSPARKNWVIQRLPANSKYSRSY